MSPKHVQVWKRNKVKKQGIMLVYYTNMIRDGLSTKH
jgi:hypothetical protein